MPNPFIQKQPLVEAAQARKLACDRTRYDAVLLQMLEESSHVGLSGGQRNCMRTFEVLGKKLQVALIGLAAQGA